MIKTFDDYQAQAMDKRLPSADQTYALLGLAGEVGELYSYVAKAIRDDYELDMALVKKELGDILWFLAAIGNDLDMSLSDIATANIEKLSRRKEAGTITGSGDNR